ncbi:MAG: hypothetical protein KIH67_003860 [Candidatus Moranbacteria bacterium]|nr:hypothetical protein [Candidatus Moranbacteria bacterium]
MGMNGLGVAFMVGLALYLGQPNTEAVASRMIPARAVDVFNGAAQEEVIVVRTASDHQILFQKTVFPGAPEPMFVRPDHWPCNTRFEASHGGRDFRPIRGDICQRSETGDPLVLIISPETSPELVPVDPD